MKPQTPKVSAKRKEKGERRKHGAVNFITDAHKIFALNKKPVIRAETKEFLPLFIYFFLLAFYTFWYSAHFSDGHKTKNIKCIGHTKKNEKEKIRQNQEHRSVYLNHITMVLAVL